jgi:hypothetical protein
MENKNQNKKPWVKPEVYLLDSGGVNNGTHPTFHEVSKVGPLTYKIVKNTPLHKTYQSSVAGWNFAAHS